MTIPNSWHGDWSNFNVAVLGLGKSGFSVADTLMELGAKVTVFAKTSNPSFEDLLSVIGAEFVKGDTASHIKDSNQKFDFAVVSPGFPPSHEIVQYLVGAEIPILTDIDLAFRLRDKTPKVADWITITGTNGKTSTSELVEHILRVANLRAVACGNIGTPILDVIREPDGYDFLVVELSSFQLHYAGEIRAEVSAFLNLAPDHIDWHGDIESYLADKSKIFHSTKTAIIFNEQDSKTFEAARAAEVIDGCRAVSFSLFTPQRSSIGYVEEFLVDRAFLEERADQALEIASVADIAEIGVVSKHLMANVAAATAITRAIGIAPNIIREAIRTFRLSPHRIEVVLISDGVTFVDDSKATNAHAAAASLEAFDSIVWIAGGLLKGVDPTDLIIQNRDKLRAVIVIGAETQTLGELLSQHAPNVPVFIVEDSSVMATAVAKAREFAQAGDTVLLAPAAASMDQFRDYADRGNAFASEVRKQLNQ